MKLTRLFAVSAAAAMLLSLQETFPFDTKISGQK